MRKPDIILHGRDWVKLWIHRKDAEDAKKVMDKVNPRL